MPGVSHAEDRRWRARQIAVDEGRDTCWRAVSAGRGLASEVAGHHIDQRTLDAMGPGRLLEVSANSQESPRWQGGTTDARVHAPIRRRRSHRRLLEITALARPISV